MASLTLRLVVNRPLTNAEVDGNFTALNNSKVEASAPVLSGTLILVAGTSSAAPILFAPGTSLATPLNGTMEYDGTDLWFTVGGVRKRVTLDGIYGDYISTIRGTPNQVAAGIVGSIATLTTPQDIGTTSSVKFGTMVVGTATEGAAGSISASGDVVAYATSDERLKIDVRPIPDALESVKAIQGVLFTWDPDKKDVHGFEGPDTGVLAQDVIRVLPEVVTMRENGFLAVKYEKMIGLLVEAVKELSDKLDKCNCSSTD